MYTPGLGEERTRRDLGVVGKMVFEKGKYVLAHVMMVHVGSGGRVPVVLFLGARLRASLMKEKPTKCIFQSRPYI
jgi:hypothetical protein